jgi:hypothetical protein
MAPINSYSSTAIAYACFHVLFATILEIFFLLTLKKSAIDLSDNPQKDFKYFINGISVDFNFEIALIVVIIIIDE